MSRNITITKILYYYAKKIIGLFVNSQDYLSFTNELHVLAIKLNNFTTREVTLTFILLYNN